MSKMNIEAVKAQMLEDVESLEGECKRLLELIPRYRSDLAKHKDDEWISSKFGICAVLEVINVKVYRDHTALFE